MMHLTLSPRIIIVCLLCVLLHHHHKGFFVLIEKEWLAFGHKFMQRLFHVGNKHDDGQISPVFIQWLDCVYQLVAQFPHAFEFTPKLLLDIAHHSFSCRFGKQTLNTPLPPL